ncbi:MAG: hypothetical protein AAB914_03625, partial [Patescibacteria group bacterium]
ENYSNNDHQIQDPVLAEHVAHAEKTEIEAGLLAVKEGRFNSVHGHFTEADKLGKIAGTAYIQSKTEQIASDRVALGLPETEPSNELEQKAELAKTALAEKYDLTPDAFSLLKYEDNKGNSVNVVALSTKEGLDLGNPTKASDKKRSYKSIMSNESGKNREAHMIEIGGAMYDDRIGMTFGAHSALADAKDFDMDRDKWTIMTGEPLTAGGDVQFANVLSDDGSVCQGFTLVEYGCRDLGFRPAVVI